MKIKIFNTLIMVNLLTILLILAIVYIPSTIARIILGVPLVLFIPGYVFLSALFSNKREMDRIQRIGLSSVLSIAIVAFIGFGLNYTAWGIRIEPALSCIAGFIFIFSIIAFIRAIWSEQIRFTTEIRLRLPSWQESKLSKAFSIILIILILSSIGTLGYTAATPKASNTFTEFYILGFNGKAQSYPQEFTMENGRVTGIRYSTEENERAGEWGKITIGVINHEQQKMRYTIIMTVDGKPININYEGSTVNQSIQIELDPDQGWEGEAGFAPMDPGDNQKVEILLLKNDNTIPDDSLQFWIDVK